MIESQPNPKTLIIAEAGVNHNGDVDTAIKLIDAAAEAGADMVKFQTFNAKKLAAANAVKADYQKRTTDGEESQLEMLTRLELSQDAHNTLIARCEEKGITFLSTAGEVDSLRFLADTLRLPVIKLGSGEVTNAPLLLAAARSDARLILSTGMARLAEIETALGILAFGMQHADDTDAGRESFGDALLRADAFSMLKSRVSLMQCTTEYPSLVEDSNLRVMDTLRSAFRLEVGYSDHTEGNAVSFAAVARGASMIEKHFTLDRTMEGPDHAASVEPEALKGLVFGIRQVEQALGNGVKRPSMAELRNRPIVRRSVVASCDLPESHVLTISDMAIKRPGYGISPVDMWDCVGRRLETSVALDQPIKKEDLV
jgi:N-acetylneuraminate synthase